MVSHHQIGESILRNIPSQQGSTLMKRFETLLCTVFLGSILAGCDSGMPIGAPAEAPKSQQTDQFKEMMRTAGPKMQSKGKGAMTKGTGEPTAKQSTTPEAP
jgi:hypothetical protein